jgi:ubiquinone/menaquinone biosynthesis C-methylase UbiE
MTFASRASDYEADRGTCKRDDVLERFSTEELLEFVRPQSEEVVLDAGCGTGANIILMHCRVKQIIAFDFAISAVKRAQERSAAAGVKNASISHGDIMHANLADGCVDKVLCLSVFQYLSDEQVRVSLRLFRRALRSGGSVVLHVKNLASPYLITLLAAKRVMRLAGRRSALDENFRTFRWYIRELESAGFEVEEFNSFNLLVLELMPTRLLRFVQRLELAHRKRFPFRTATFRRHGADLKIRARVPS